MDQFHSENTTKPDVSTESFMVSSQELTAVISSDKFKRALLVSGTRTQETGNETSFHSFITPNKELLIGHIREGGTDSTAGTVILDTIDTKIPLSTGQFIDHHFHPDAEGFIEPSSQDLTMLSYQFDDVSTAPIISIGIIRPNNDIDTILIKSPIGTIDRRRLLQYERLCHQAHSQEDIMEILEEIGLKASILKYKYQKGAYTLTRESQDALKKFGNTKVTPVSPTE